MHPAQSNAVESNKVQIRSYEIPKIRMHPCSTSDSHFHTHLKIAAISFSAKHFSKKEKKSANDFAPPLLDVMSTISTPTYAVRSRIQLDLIV